MTDDDFRIDRGMSWLRGYRLLFEMTLLMFWPLIYAGEIGDRDEEIQTPERRMFGEQPSATVIDLAAWRDRRAAGAR
jgi:hypothetical protein